MSNYTWWGGNPGDLQSKNWWNPLSPELGVPGDGDTAVLGSGTYTGSLEVAEATLGSGYGPTTLNGSIATNQLNIFGDVTVGQRLAAVAASFMGNLTVKGEFTVVPDEVKQLSGIIRVAGGGHSLMSGFVQRWLGWGDVPELKVDAGGKLSIASGGHLAIETQGTFEGEVAASDAAVYVGTTPASSLGKSPAVLYVQNGATVRARDTVVAASAGEDGTLVVDGAGTNYVVGDGAPETPRARLAIGGSEGLPWPDGGTGHVTVSNGAKFVASDVTLGESAGSAGNLTIESGGSMLVGWMVAGGMDGATGHVSVQQGGALRVHLLGAGQIGLLVGSAGQGTLDVRGSGSAVTLEKGSFVVGSLRGQGDVSVMAGGSVQVQGDGGSASQVVVGDTEGARGTVLISGQGSSLMTPSALVGDLGIGDVRIEAGGSMAVTGPGIDGLTLGRGVTGSGTITVGGAGSKLVSTTEIRVGDFGQGKLVVQSGGAVEASASGSGPAVSVGTDAGGFGVVQVSGGGSSLQALAGSIRVGEFGSGSLQVAADGTVRAHEVEVGVGQAGSVTVEGSGSALDAGTSLDIGGTEAAKGVASTVTASNGGAVRAQHAVIWAGSALSADGGAVGIGTDGANGAISVGSLGSISGAGLLDGDVVNEGTIVVSGGTLELTGAESGSGLIEFDGAGTLRLDHSGAASGAIGPMSAGDAVDLVDINFGNASWAYENGVLTVSDGLRTANLHVAGGYSTDSFALHSDGRGGSLLSTVGDQAEDIAFTDATASRSGVAPAGGYSGPVGFLDGQFIWAGSHNVAVTAGHPNVFLKGGSGDDALAASSGSNVLDGGLGSNFLVGATGADGGADVFFVDARGGGTTWSTVVNFHERDAFTLWGFDARSTFQWAADDGVDGYRGATLHAQTHGAGTPTDGSVTFAGLSVTEAQRLLMSTGSSDGQSYLLLQHGG